MRAEGKQFGGYGRKLVIGVALTLGALVALPSCSEKPLEFKPETAGSSGSGGSTGASAGKGAEANGGGTDSSTGGGSSTGKACEPGTVESCYESPEGESYGEVPATPVGSCKIGMRVCGTGATWGACLGAVAAAEVDTCVPGNDDNCNGTPNEGCGCTEPNATRSCGTDEGECVAGTQTCGADLTWGTCEGEVVAQGADTCDEGNDANCDGQPNVGCECINGTTQPCGINTGNCQQGTQTCVNGVWSQTCDGEIAPEAKDACDPKGDDADCDGFPNEDCACTAGDTQDCGNCGTLSCKSDGTWETECKGQGECSPGEVENDSEVCGNCGSQALRRTCSNSCEWGAWADQGTCVGSGPCKVGDPDETRSIACGNCSSGLQQQKRSCTAQCGWPTSWTNVGSCTGQGCTPGTTKAESDVSCGYCNGTQKRISTCSASCTWGQPTNDGVCQQASCPSFPGDERVGYVTCFNDWPDLQAAVCTPSQQCCLTPQSTQGCKASCAAGDKRTECDGPEDCGGSNCCINFDVATQSSYGTCTAGACPDVTMRRCHTNADCPAAASVCRTGYPTTNGYNGRCSFP